MRAAADLCGGGRTIVMLSTTSTEHLQRGHVAQELSQLPMQSPWKMCLHDGTCINSSFSSNSPKHTQHLHQIYLPFDADVDHSLKFNNNPPDDEVERKSHGDLTISPTLYIDDV
ncbi:hypothetical protein ACET3Z_028002 [Daucus carota]